MRPARAYFTYPSPSVVSASSLLHSAYEVIAEESELGICLGHVLGKYLHLRGDFYTCSFFHFVQQL